MQSTAVAQIPQHQRVSLVRKFAQKFHIEEERLLPILKATAFKVKEGEVSNEQMAALLIVADQYGLNPFTREIFAFPDKQNGIVPVVSVDGWARIINEHLMMNGLEFRYSETMIEPGDKRCPGLKHAGHEWIEVVIYRKDRERPTVVREYLEEVYRPPFKRGDYVIESAWQSHTKRFHRHKALIQGARIAFGFGGLFDEDEANRIIDGQVVVEALPSNEQPTRGAAALRAAVVDDGINLEQSNNAASQGQASPGGPQGGDVPARETVAGSPADAAPPKKEPGTAAVLEKILKSFKASKNAEMLALVRDEANLYEWAEADLETIDVAYSKRQDELKGA